MLCAECQEKCFFWGVGGHKAREGRWLRGSMLWWMWGSSDGERAMCDVGLCVKCI